VLFLSRISWKKGLDRLITAWQSIPDVDLVIAGNDDENYLPMLRELAQSTGVAERVRFLGPVSDTHKWALYENAALFVLPSYSENFGNVVAEAMAAGCAVVVSPEVGISSLVRAVECGVVTPCDPPVLAAVINRLLADTAGRLELARRGKEAARKQLSWAGVAGEMENFYRHAMALPSGESVAAPAGST
jgi:glycosyltransferase involved in cell wall biosynthesis